MGYLKRAGGRILSAVVVLGVIMAGVWIFDRFDGNSDSASLKDGECFIMTDGPTRGSGGEEEVGILNEQAQEEYPSVNCDDWKTQEKPWLVYRVEWTKKVNDDNGTLVELQSSCPDLTIYDATEVTCLANMEFINS